MCICFSPMGTQLKESHPQFESHESYYKKYSMVSDVMVVENVVEYGDEIAKNGWEKIGKCVVFTLTLET